MFYLIMGIHHRTSGELNIVAVSLRSIPCSGPGAIARWEMDEMDERMSRGRPYHYSGSGVMTGTPLARLKPNRSKGPHFTAHSENLVVCHFEKKIFGWHPANSAEVQHSQVRYSECAAHICGLSNFDEICNGQVRPHLRSSGVCASVHDWHRRPPALQLLKLSVTLHLHP
jgi:hypothetical protein